MSDLSFETTTHKLFKPYFFQTKIDQDVVIFLGLKNTVIRKLYTNINY